MANWVTLQNGVHIDLDDPDNPVTGSGSYESYLGGDKTYEKTLASSNDEIKSENNKTIRKSNQNNRSELKINNHINVTAKEMSAVANMKDYVVDDNNRFKFAYDFEKATGISIYYDGGDPVDSLSASTLPVSRIEWNDRTTKYSYSSKELSAELYSYLTSSQYEEHIRNTLEEYKSDYSKNPENWMKKAIKEMETFLKTKK